MSSFVPEPHPLYLQLLSLGTYTVLPWVSREPALASGDHRQRGGPPSEGTVSSSHSCFQCSSGVVSGRYFLKRKSSLVASWPINFLYSHCP